MAVDAAEQSINIENQAQDDGLEPLITLASALLDTDRLRIAAALVAGPASRNQLHEATGLSHRDLLRQVGILEEAGLIQPEIPTRQPDPYTPYVLRQEAFTAARKAMGKYKGVKKRPSDTREMILETFMPGGKLTALPHKQNQIVTVLTEIAQKFEPEKQYTEREVNVILEDINEDYCTVRRYLVDYGYMSRTGGGSVYTRNT